MEIKCPSGMRGTIRGMKVKETALFTDVKILRQGRLITEILRNCWVDTIDSAPYNFGKVPGDRVPWDTILQADRMFIFKEIRQATYGDELEWEVQCSNEACRGKFVWVEDLSKVKVTPIPEASKPFCATGEPFMHTIGGRKVQWRLLQGMDDANLIALIKDRKYPILTASYMCRLVSVEGIPSSDIEAIRDWIDNLDASESEFFEVTMTEAEPNVELSTKITCPHCEESWDSSIPLMLNFLRRKGKK